MRPTPPTPRTSRRLLAGAVLLLGASAAAAAPPAPDWAGCTSVDPATGESRIDPHCFFDVLVDRYRRLSVYEDVARVRQVTQRSGEAPQRVDTRIGVEVEGGELRVETPGSMFRRAVGLDLPFRTSPALRSGSMEYKIWLAPHMALKFRDEPKQQFRPGVEQAFTATEAKTTLVHDKPMVHLELKSGEGEDCAATFDLYVNPDSMLVEHIHGQQRLPDGATYETTLDITPTYIESDDHPEPILLPARPIDGIGRPQPAPAHETQPERETPPQRETPPEPEIEPPAAPGRGDPAVEPPPAAEPPRLGRRIDR